MKSKRKFLISTLAVVLTAALAVGVFFLTKAVTRPMSAEEYMLQGTQERIEYVQSQILHYILIVLSLFRHHLSYF